MWGQSSVSQIVANSDTSSDEGNQPFNYFIIAYLLILFLTK